MTDERTCPKSPHGTHDDPGNSGQCIYCGAVLDGSDGPSAGDGRVPMAVLADRLSTAMRRPVSTESTELKPLTDEDLASLENIAGPWTPRSPEAQAQATLVLRLVAEVRRARQARATVADFEEKLARATKAVADFGEALRKMRSEP